MHAKLYRCNILDISNMKHLVIRHFGPIEEVNIELKRINVIIGPQSSGKSTVLKVACFCDWLERQIELTQNPKMFCQEQVLHDNLIVFHKLEGYKNPESYIFYENDALLFEYSEKSKKFRFEWKNKRWDYKRSKICYIPAERNLLATIPNWYQVSFSKDNILDFLKDWEFARKNFTKKTQLMSLPFQYQYNQSSRTDKIVLKSGAEIFLANASSGLQSLTPLYIMINYLTDAYFKETQNTVEEYMISDNLKNNVKIECTNKSIEQQEEIINNIVTAYRSDLFIEEPESHLFPTTQKEFVYTLMAMLNARKKHHCFIATHSPYILTAFNNLILAAAKSKESKDIAKKVHERIPSRMKINFNEVAAFEMKDGFAHSIMDKDEQLIQAEAIDIVSEEISEDFDYLLNL